MFIFLDYKHLFNNSDIGLHAALIEKFTVRYIFDYYFCFLKLSKDKKVSYCL